MLTKIILTGKVENHPYMIILVSTDDMKIYLFSNSPELGLGCFASVLQRARKALNPTLIYCRLYRRIVLLEFKKKRRRIKSALVFAHSYLLCTWLVLVRLAAITKVGQEDILLYSKIGTCSNTIFEQNRYTFRIPARQIDNFLQRATLKICMQKLHFKGNRSELLRLVYYRCYVQIPTLN